MSAIKAIPKPNTIQKLTSVNEQVWLKLGRYTHVCICVCMCVCACVNKGDDGANWEEKKKKKQRGGACATRLYFNFVLP
jgi:hypothetical protein